MIVCVCLCACVHVRAHSGFLFLPHPSLILDRLSELAAHFKAMAS